MSWIGFLLKFYEISFLASSFCIKLKVLKLKKRNSKSKKIFFSVQSDFNASYTHFWRQELDFKVKLRFNAVSTSFFCPPIIGFKMQKKGQKTHVFTVNICLKGTKFFQNLIFLPCQVIKVIPQPKQGKTGLFRFEQKTPLFWIGSPKWSKKCPKWPPNPPRWPSYVKNISIFWFPTQNHEVENFIP